MYSSYQDKSSQYASHAAMAGEQKFTAASEFQMATNEQLFDLANAIGLNAGMPADTVSLDYIDYSTGKHENHYRLTWNRFNKTSNSWGISEDYNALLMKYLNSLNFSNAKFQLRGGFHYGYYFVRLSHDEVNAIFTILQHKAAQQKQSAAESAGKSNAAAAPIANTTILQTIRELPTKADLLQMSQLNVTTQQTAAQPPEVTWAHQRAAVAPQLPATRPASVILPNHPLYVGTTKQQEIHLQQQLIATQLQAIEAQRQKLLQELKHQERPAP